MENLNTLAGIERKKQGDYSLLDTRSNILRLGQADEFRLYRIMLKYQTSTNLGGGGCYAAIVAVVNISTLSG
jgi:hypothetical protein